MKQEGIERDSRRVDTSAAPDDDFDIRARIVSAATRLFEKHGFRKTSMDAITKAARTSKRSVYEHFSDKHAVLSAVLEAFIDQRFEDISQLQTKSSSDIEKLRWIARALLKAAQEDEGLAMYRVLLAEATYVPDIAKASYERGLRQVNGLVKQPLANLGVSDSATAGRLFYDLFVLAPMNRGLVGAKAAPAKIDLMVSLIVDGLKPSGRSHHRRSI